MTNIKSIIRRRSVLAFVFIFGLSLTLGAVIGMTRIAEAAPLQMPVAQIETYAGSDACAQCHENIHNVWVSTRHAQAFSSPIFQRDWDELGSQVRCLECHTTGFNPSTGLYAQEGVSCEACHGPFQPGHPQQLMPIAPDADLCSTCHKQTTDEWTASEHGQKDIQCQACHNPHSQTPKADSVTDLCSNCHKELGDTFTHGTHANSGLECSNCHMYTSPRTNDPIEGLVPTGHTFSVGSDACIACHQETVHTRNEIIKLRGEVVQTSEVNVESLRKTVQEQEDMISILETQSTVRLYTGLAQGAIVGLITGAAAAWVVSRSIRIVEVEEDDQEKETS